ncbi:MAG TPA: PEP-CTERM sorting domain-containing protein [Lacipirellula sp.]
MIKRFAVAVVLTTMAFLQPLQAQTGTVLVGDPFTHSYQDWVDAFPTTRSGNWRLSLHNPTMIDTNNANPPTSGAVTDSGTYEPDVLINDDFLAPASYEYTATMRTNDDDIIGLVWNYQDPDNYFRVGVRTQNSGSFGGTRGLAVQKIVGGVVTQLNPMGTGPGTEFPITQDMINNRTPFDLRVEVDGSNYEVYFDGVLKASGADSDLAAARKIGVQSWAQLSDTDGAPDPAFFWGSELESVDVTGGGSPLFSESFDARAVPFRTLVMTNEAGVNGLGGTIGKDVLGNFGVDLESPWIFQHSNGFEYATGPDAEGDFSEPDFIGPAVVVDQAGSDAFSDYEMRVRLGAVDNDGLGVLVRVQDDSSFYRINFTNEALGTNSAQLRAPQGLSVQKVQNGQWTELFRDDQTNPLFVHTVGPVDSSTGLPPMFDLSVKAIGNTLDIQVIDALGNVIDYPLITDNSSPLLTGTVGLTTWGSENVFFTGYGGQAGPLVVAIPEPATLLLAAAGGVAMLRRRRN